MTFWAMVGWMFRSALVVALLTLAFVIRHPILIPLRPWAALGAGGVGILLFLWSVRGTIRSGGGLSRLFHGAVAVATVAAVSTVTLLETRTGRLRAQVLAADAGDLAAIGRHLMVTLPKASDTSALLEQVQISGIFLTRRVTGPETAEEIGARVAALQRRRVELGLPLLHVAADQEGGIVAGMTPPLARPPRLATIGDDAGLDAAAITTAGDIARAGINLNFAPVADLLHGTVVEDDRWSFLGRRAIAADGPATVRVAARWCKGLMSAGIGCTLKHYPGLGRATGDTHLVAARLQQIADDDLAPFLAIPPLLPRLPWIMAGHVTIVADDPYHPASASPAVIGRLRRAGFDGIVVTDDATMVAYQENLAENVVSSLESGVDLILVTYDEDLVWHILATLLDARRAGHLTDAVLAGSSNRLAREAPDAVRCLR